MIEIADDSELALRLDLLCESFRYWMGRDVIAPGPGRAQRLYDAQAIIVAHGTEAEPVFWFGNRAAQRVWELDWPAFTRLPSRQSAPSGGDETRRRALLAQATRDGFITGLSGVRMSARGRRFWIEDVIVWNLVDAQGVDHGQAATYQRWRYLPEV